MNKFFVMIVSVFVFAGKMNLVYAGENCMCNEAKKTELKEQKYSKKKIVAFAVLAGVSFYFRNDLHALAKKHITYSNAVRAGDFIVKEIVVPVSERFKKEGPRLIRERAISLIMSTAIGGVSALLWT